MEQVDAASYTTKPSSKTMERRTSTNSESSIEQVDVNTRSNKTLSSDANSSLALKTSQESDNVESDDNEDYLNNNTCKSSKNENNEMRGEHEKSTETSKSKEAIRRDNLSQLMDKLKQQKKFMSSPKNNNHSSEENLNSASLENEHDSSKQTSSDETKYICPICETVSLTQHDFTNHIRNHNNMRDSSDDGTSFTCRICSKVLSSASSLDRHVLVHTGERPFNCKYCNLTFTTNGNMHRHMRTHKQHQQHESYESDASTDSSGSHGHHRNYPHKRKSTEDELSNRRKIRAVNYNNNNITSPNPLQKFCCPVCIRNDFASMINLENHMDKEHPTIPAKCRHCEMVFKSHKALNSHRCVNNKGISVQQGFQDLTFVDFTSEKFPIIAKSLCERDIRTPITNQKYECPICYRAFPCSSSVEIHVHECKNQLKKAQDCSAKRRRSNSESSDDDNDDSKREDFFAMLALQNRHSSPSTPTSHAEKSYSSLASMIKQEHRETPPFYQYFSEGRSDIADIESIIKATSSSGLERAMSERESSMYRDDEEPQDAFTAEFRKMKLRGEFPCRLCTMVFPNLRALKGHNRIHLSASGPGPYRCNMCPYSINDKAALIRHMRSHNGDRPYECALCNYAFTTKANCERHLRNRHGRTTRDEVKRAIIYHPSEDSSVDDHSKKIALYQPNRYHSGGGSDRSTPVSHLKDILQDDSPSRIQVKSLEKLKQRDFENDIEEEDTDSHHHHHRPVDMSLSMDALDLSKKADSFMKSNKTSNNGNDASDEDDEDDEVDHRDELEHPKIPKFDLGLFEKNLLIQQQLLSETLPKLDPAQMFALFNRTFGFPGAGFPIHPALLLQNPLLMNPDAMKNFLPQSPQSQTNLGQTKSGTPSMSGGSLIVNPFASPDSSPNGPPNQHNNRNIDESPVRNSMPVPPFPPTPQESPKKVSPTQMSQLQNTGPVKMVIKNGVLMPKQKQRRYRTERPFACEHCSARFTLRSNMERHIKQQHPQFWAQRQRGNHGLLRRGPQPQMSQMNGSSMMPTLQASGFSGISDQVKYAILAQQLKSRESPKNVMNSPYPMSMPVQTQLTTPDDDDDDDDEDENEVDDDCDEKPQHRRNEDDDDDDQLVIDEDFHGEDLSKSSIDMDKNAMAKKIAENILEEAKMMGNPRSREFDIKSEVDDCDKDHEKRESKEEGNDLVSVSKLVDNATNSMMFSNYFNSRNDQHMTDQSDEEGLVASGSASESGTDDPSPSRSLKEKKKSAYSLAPNRVSCPYCQRKFPWSSSLRRHVLTHTGQKPFKCSQCPLLFTTKSNCDRHLLRKHGNIESAVSLQLPIDEMPEPVKEPVRPSRKTSSEEPKITTPTFQLSAALQMPALKLENVSATPVVASELPFKCHLCDGSFSDRIGCLEHIKSSHAQDFAVLMSKVQLETEENVQGSPDDDDHADKKGKYPDYANRKVICAFCLRRFWSTEDLRRHMRTHSGERPFNCDVCFRKFTLKHSMLRHRKKHSNAPNNLNNFHNMKSENGENNGNGSSINNSASDLSDEESTSLAVNNHKKLLEMMSQVHSSGVSASKADQELVSRMVNNPINKELFMKFQEKFFSMQQQVNSELLGNLLGISDQGVLNRMFSSSADEAAKMLGVEKN